MSSDGERLIETVTLNQAKALVKCLAEEQSLLLLSPPGVGKSDTVMQAAAEAGLPCRSLLGTQIAPEDVTGIPRIVGERSVFCPPRVLLPESPEPFCLFLDELPACTPDIQKAFYSLLLERRLGEHRLPKGTWVVAAGNRSEDRALVRTISSALVNRVILLQVRVDVDEWLAWGAENKVRSEILTYIRDSRVSLLRPVPRDPVPFSTPRGWAQLSRALELAEQGGILDDEMREALTAGRVSEEDVTPFCNWARVHSSATVNLSQLTMTRLLNTGIWELNLSQRAVNALEAIGISIIRDLVIRKEIEFSRKNDFDQARVAEIKERLAERGLSLGMTV